MNKYETIFLLNIKLLEKDQKKILDKIIKCISDFGKINDIWIRCVNYKFFLNIIVKLLIFLGLCIVR